VRRVALDQPGNVERMRAANDGEAEMHLHGMSCCAASRAEAVHHQIAEGLLPAAEGDGLPPCRRGQAFRPARQNRDGGHTPSILNATWWRAAQPLTISSSAPRYSSKLSPVAKALKHRMCAVAVVVAGVAVPPASEGVDAHHGIVVGAERLARIEEGIAVGSGDQPFDAGALDDLFAPPRPL